MGKCLSENVKTQFVSFLYGFFLPFFFFPFLNNVKADLFASGFSKSVSVERYKQCSELNEADLNMVHKGQLIHPCCPQLSSFTQYHLDLLSHFCKVYVLILNINIVY